MAGIMKLVQLLESRKAVNCLNDSFYISIEDLILKEGTLFSPSHLSIEEEDIVKKAHSKSKASKIKECFYNSQLLALYDNTNSIEYWEGYTTSEFADVPILHGFNVINGKVVDLTHKINNKQIFGDFGENKEYMGVKFNTQKIRDQIMAEKTVYHF